MRKLTLCFTISLVFLCLSVRAQSAPSAPENEALSAAAKSLCHAHIAMLGEIATHGDGQTLAFKVALVERLVDRCGFDSVLFEANLDEFIRLNQRLRSGQTVTSEDLLTAVGGLWKFYKDFQPLGHYLLTRAQAGRVFLGGLDDQLGQPGQNYANDEMVAEFSSLLPASEQQSCRALLHRRIYMNYPESAPYSKLDQSHTLTCLNEVETASVADETLTGTAKKDRQEMISATKRWVGRDFTPADESMVNRDRSMFQTFQWWQNRLPKKHKVIIWAATVHIAKQGDPVWGDRVGTNFGSFIHQEYGNYASSLGFSAVSGSFRQGKGKFPPIPIAPDNSVEAAALRGTRTGYLNARQLAALGTLPGAFFYHSYQTLAWSNFLDGVVVFRAERPPTDTR